MIDPKSGRFVSRRTPEKRIADRIARSERGEQERLGREFDHMIDAQRYAILPDIQPIRHRRGSLPWWHRLGKLIRKH